MSDGGAAFEREDDLFLDRHANCSSEQAEEDYPFLFRDMMDDDG